MKKKDLQQLSGVSPATITKLGRNENVNTIILQKICNAMECDICDILEFIPDKIKKGKVD
jgi:DNA-binding Xre family transcriptional regulator